jgi:hypothetical protein
MCSGTHGIVSGLLIIAAARPWTNTEVSRHQRAAVSCVDALFGDGRQNPANDARRALVIQMIIIEIQRNAFFLCLAFVVVA